MSICKEKKESIKSTTIWLYCFFKLLKDRGSIDGDEYDRLLQQLKKLERCTNLDRTFTEEK